LLLVGEEQEQRTAVAGALVGLEQQLDLQFPQGQLIQLP
jgi:hypothetical protein